MVARTPRIANRIISHDGEERLLPLLVLLVGGVLVYFPVSPGTYLMDVTEVVIPLGIAGGLFGIVCLLRFYGDSTSLDTQFGFYTWLGALVGGSAGVWLLIHELRYGSSFALIYNEALTILSIGIACGAIVAISIDHRHRHTSPSEAAHTAVLAESTWTDQPGAHPIAMELVEQIADLEGSGPLELEALSTYIDTDVFQALRSGGNSPWQLIFYTSKYEIRVNSQGTITICDEQQLEEERGVAPVYSPSGRVDVSYSTKGSQESGVSGHMHLHPAGTVYEVVAEHEQVETTVLPPLDKWVQPETLDALTGSWEQLDRSLEFRYLWYRVTVHPSGDVRLLA